MGGSASKKSKNNTSNDSVGHNSPQPLNELGGGNPSVEPRCPQDAGNLERLSSSAFSQSIRNTVTDDWFLMLEDRGANRNAPNVSAEAYLQFRNPPPPYAEFDPLTSANNYNDSNNANQRFRSIPNLMDVDCNDSEEVLQPGGSRYSGPVLGNPHFSRHLSREDTLDYKSWDHLEEPCQTRPSRSRTRSTIRDNFASSEPNADHEFENNIKLKLTAQNNWQKNTRSKSQKPDGLTRRRGFQSSPNVDSLNPGLQIFEQEPTQQQNRSPKGKQCIYSKSSGNANGRNNKLTSDQLTALSMKSDQEILFRIQNFSTGFVSLLHESDYPDEMLILIMAILAKVCRNDDCPHTANAILQTVLYTKLFNVRMVKYLQTAPYDDSMDKNSMLLQNLLLVFTTVLREFKREAANKLRDCLTLGRRAIIRRIGPNGDCDDELIKALRDLTDVEKLNKERDPCQNSVFAQEFLEVYTGDYEPPPGTKPPTSEEYKLYLLQLLRKELVDTMKVSPAEVAFQPPTLYQRVHVIGADCTFDEGVVHKLSFEIDDEDKVTGSDATKLLEGSTVFLSHLPDQLSDCAIVVRSRPEELSQGHVWVKLLDQKSTILQCVSPFYMVENFTYKGDIVCLMEALHFQIEYPLPFTKHILGMKQKVSHPKYLDNSSLFIFPSIANKGKNAKKFNALNTSTWPSAESFGYDALFLDAFKYCLTKELALIHSTSSTMSIEFGVCVLQTLLHNEALWHASQTPIIVLFHSDNSLDDFLKAVVAVSPNEKLIRMGGNRQDVLLRNYDLDEARRIVCNSENYPPYVMQNRRVLRDKMCKLKTEIIQKTDLLEKARVQLLNDEVLKNYISSVHYKLLKSLNADSESDALIKWLFPHTSSELLGLQSELNDISGKPPKVVKSKLRKKNQFPKESNVTCNHLLSRMEMDRRFISFPSAEFDGSDARLNQNTYTFDAGNFFITQEEVSMYQSICQFQGKKFSFTDIIKLELATTKDVLNESEVDDVCLLRIRDRWRLYRYWLSKFEMHTTKELVKTREKYEKSFLQLQEVVREIDVSILRRAKFVGLTTAAAASYHRLLKMVAPRIIIVEDAGKIAEPRLIANLTEHCCHLILIGDHKQLRPTINEFCSSDKANRPRTISLFEKLINKGITHVPLTNSNLMSTSLLTVLRGLFDDLPYIPADAACLPKSTISGMASDIFFINNCYPESEVVGHPFCYTNEFEANYLVLLAKYLISRGYEQTKITILATCNGQVSLLLNLSKKNNLDQIQCAAVEDYQGKSNDIILLSLVRSNEHEDVFPLDEERYMYVALTRARLGLYCIGNFKMLVNFSDSWKAYITFLAGQQLYGSTLYLKCDWHQMETYAVGSVEDLKNAANSICKRPCDTIMPCGHKCTKVCHAEDRNHKNVKCKLPCQKIVCPANHRCQKMCFEKCPPCVRLCKKVQSCGHESMVRCSEMQKKTKCAEKCTKKLACGHACSKRCGEKCDDSSCTVMDEYHESPCSHVFFISCSQKLMRNLDKLCPMPCTEVLPCGHRCTGTCGECKRGRMHIPCRAPCESILLCGHPCRELCGSNCGPCKETCGSHCDHTKCPSSCGSPCVPCLEPCAWKCPHKRCNKMCFELCDRDACNFPCPRMLPCKHPCIGLCGESCPTLCRICDRAKLLEGMPGANHIDKARFVLLEDCDHVVEVTSLNKLMFGHGTIDVKICPICGVPIRKCFRYGNIIKSTVFDVNRIIHQCKEGDSGMSISLSDLRNSISSLPETDAVKQTKIEVRQNLNCQEAIVMANKLSFLQCMFELGKSYLRLTLRRDRSEVYHILFHVSELYMTLTPASGQVVLNAFTCELKRAMYLIHIISALKNNPALSPAGKILYDNLHSTLTDTKTFNAAVEAVVVRQVNKLYSTMNVNVSRLKEIGNVPVSDVFQMTAGNWKKCENGHFSFSRAGQQVHCKKCTSARGQ